MRNRSPARCASGTRGFVGALLLAVLVMSGLAPMTAQAADVDLTPGPTVVQDPSSPTGYTGHFVYRNTTATSERFVADIKLRNWAYPSDTTIYEPSEYRPGLMRGGGGYVPYDAKKQAYGPLAAHQIENPRPGSPKGEWSYVPFEVAGTTRTTGVYLPPGYDANRAEPYKTIYLQHGSGQDQSDWMNMGDAPVIMDNLIQDGLTEPAVVVTEHQRPRQRRSRVPEPA